MPWGGGWGRWYPRQVEKDDPNLPAMTVFVTSVADNLGSACFIIVSPDVFPLRDHSYLNTYTCPTINYWFQPWFTTHHFSIYVQNIGECRLVHAVSQLPLSHVGRTGHEWVFDTSLLIDKELT